MNAKQLLLEAIALARRNAELAGISDAEIEATIISACPRTGGIQVGDGDGLSVAGFNLPEQITAASARANREGKPVLRLWHNGKVKTVSFRGFQAAFSRDQTVALVRGALINAHEFHKHEIMNRMGSEPITWNVEQRLSEYAS